MFLEGEHKGCEGIGRRDWVTPSRRERTFQVQQSLNQIVLSIGGELRLGDDGFTDRRRAW